MLRSELSGQWWRCDVGERITSRADMDRLSFPWAPERFQRPMTTYKSTPASNGSREIHQGAQIRRCNLTIICRIGRLSSAHD